MFQDGPGLVKKLQGIFGFVIKDGPGGTTGKWIVDAKTGSGEVVYDSDSKFSNSHMYSFSQK